MMSDDPQYPLYLAAHGRPFEEALASLQDTLTNAHATKNYGLVVDLEGTRVSMYSMYERPASEQAAALETYYSMQPDPVARAEKAGMVCNNCRELIPRFLPSVMAEIEALPQEPRILALLERLRAVATSAS